MVMWALEEVAERVEQAVLGGREGAEGVGGCGVAVVVVTCGWGMGGGLCLSRASGAIAGSSCEED